MNPLLKKEIRLVLPAWLAVLLLELLLPWLAKDLDLVIGTAPVFFFFGIVLLAVDSFGREFSLGTFSALMALPVPRREIWRTKLTVLLIAAGLVFAAYFLSCELRLHVALADTSSVWHANPKLISGEFGVAMGASMAVLLVALTGGLWTALLLRQAAAAFWITFLAPAGLLLGIIFFMTLLFKSTSDTVAFTVLYGAATIYTGFAFWLAYRLFFRAEDVGWTGGVISFSKWRYFERTAQSVTSLRQHRPYAALLKKEFQLHSISLFGAGALLGLHFAVFFLRAGYAQFHRNSMAAAVSDYFWVLWLVIPLVMGCSAVAEERKLGVTDGQFCQPASRRRQFVVKMVTIMIFGMLLGGGMPIFLETCAAMLGSPSEFFKSGAQDNQYYQFGNGVVWFWTTILLASAGLAWVGFFASTLARNFLHALSIAIVLLVVCGFITTLIGLLGDHGTIFGLMPIPWILITFLAIPSLAGMFLWLGYRNFISYQESARLWWRNIAGISGSVLLVVSASALIYSRVWEVFKPAEVPHGLAKLSLANPPVLQPERYGTLQVRLPDGRVWSDSLGGYYWAYENNPWKQLWAALLNPLPVSDGPRAYIGGSNWVSSAVRRLHFWDDTGLTPPQSRQVTGYLDTIAIQSDGSLWISSEVKPTEWTGAKMIRWGGETNWRQVIVANANYLLLKTDGTLWQWGPGHINWREWRSQWPTVRNLAMRQVGTNSDWQALFASESPFARKTDGTVWRLDQDWQLGTIELKRQTDLDSVVPRTFSGRAYVGGDGSLWVANHYAGDETRWSGTGYFQTSQAANWVSVAATDHWLIALKKDGSLWKWDLTGTESAAAAFNRPPTQVGIHADWVALASTESGTVTLAADGSLWLWPDLPSYQPTLLKLPKQPKFLGNIFAAS